MNELLQTLPKRHPLVEAMLLLPAAFPAHEPLALMAAERHADLIAPLLAVATAFGLRPTGASGELMRRDQLPHGGTLKVRLWIHPSPLRVFLGTPVYGRAIRAGQGLDLAGALREALEQILGSSGEAH